jgi:hypothetical protein
MKSSVRGGKLGREKVGVGEGDKIGGDGRGVSYL